MIEENSNVIDGKLENNTIELNANLDFRGNQGPQGIQGEKGDTGFSIFAIVKKSGSGASGSTDIYSVLINDDEKTEIGTFSVYNGVDGSGGSSAGIWGQITGNIASQNDLVDLLSKKAGIDSIPTKLSELENDSGYAKDISVTNIIKSLGLDEDTYSSSSTYSAGDLVVYNHAIYQCKIAVATAEKFDSSKWELVPFFVNE